MSKEKNEVKKKSVAKKTKKNSKPNFRKYILYFWLLFAAPFIGLFLIVLIAGTRNLPNTEELTNPKTYLATEIYTSDLEVIGRYYRQNRSNVDRANIPNHLVNALTSTEDVRYDNHAGIDFRGLARAVGKLGKSGGGSTISQQLAKLLFTKKYEKVGFVERALQKPKEWVLATRLERRYTKDEIITLYLNRYDFSNQAVGIKSAAYVYFDKSVDSLNVQESAMLVGMLKNSSLFNPLSAKRKDTVKFRRNTVLNQMSRYGHITAEERDSLKLLPLGLHPQKVSHDEGPAPYFREVMRAEVTKILGEKNDNDDYVITDPNGKPYNLYEDGLKIFTTLDSRMQDYAEDAVNEHMVNHLQKEFIKDLKKRSKDDYPFYSGIKDSDKAKIMGRAIKNSERSKSLHGKLCPDCKRPAVYIKSIEENGLDYYLCDDKNKKNVGCGEKWRKYENDSIDIIMNTPTKMKIFQYGGDVDTILSPIDSIKHMKTFLQAGMMSVDPKTGQIKAWVGGTNFKTFQYDNVFQMRRQVGSTFKPFVYATAMRFGEHPCSEYPNTVVCVDMPEGQKPWCPENSDFRYGDMCSLKYALANSVNTITATLIKKYGHESVIQLAHDLGIESEIPNVPAIGLGVAELSLYEMVAANSTFVNGGVYIKPYFISHIEDKNGNLIYENPLVIRQALDEKTAYLTLQLMKGVVDGAYNRDRGSTNGTALARLRYDSPYREYDNIKEPMAGKTGTTQNNTDGWFMGLTPDLVTGVWAGGLDSPVRFSSTRQGQGANMALPIYGYFMHDVYDDETLDISKKDFKKPSGLSMQEEFNCADYYSANDALEFDPLEEDDNLFE